MNLNDGVVYRCLRLGPLHQLHPGRSRSLVRYHDRLHENCLLGYLSLCWICSSDKGGDGVIERRDVADVRPQSSVPHPPDDFTQLGTIGLDNEVNRQAIEGLSRFIARLARRHSPLRFSFGGSRGAAPMRDERATYIAYSSLRVDDHSRAASKIIVAGARHEQGS